MIKQNQIKSISRHNQNKSDDIKHFEIDLDNAEQYDIELVDETESLYNVEANNKKSEEALKQRLRVVKYIKNINDDMSFKGRLRFFLYKLWIFIRLFESLYQILIIVLFTSLTQYITSKNYNNLELGAELGSITGFCVGVMIIAVYYLIFHVNAIVDPGTNRRIYNDFHISSKLYYIFLLILLFVSSYLIWGVKINCVKKKKECYFTDILGKQNNSTIN